MKPKTCLVICLMAGLCLKAGTGSSLRAQGDETSKMPISFNGLGSDQAIRFYVSVKHKHFGAAFVRFEVETSNQPQPEVKMRLCINASMVVPQIEKEWGHHVGEQVIRSLPSRDLTTLENFLNAHRAAGAALPHPSTGGDAEFDLVTYRTAKDGTQRPDVDKKEYYNPLPDAARETFVKNFIGFNG